MYIYIYIYTYIHTHIHKVLSVFDDSNVEIESRNISQALCFLCLQR